MRVAVVLPTYNERENIERMLRALMDLDPAPAVVVVDDDSPDGTGTVALEWAQRCPDVRVICRKDERGLGSAYLVGFRCAIEHGFEAVATMDCDFSHSPVDLNRLIQALDQADLVIGSRYVPGGGTKGWPWYRRLLSMSANLFARRLMGLPPRDCTSGFRVYRAELVCGLLREPLRSEGYSMLVELLFLAVKRLNARTAEVPILFTERERGSAKMSLREAPRGVCALLALRVHMASGWGRG